MMLVSRTNSRLYLLDSGDVEADVLPDHVRAHRAHAVEILDWARSYLCQPHAHLGREGPVCPYTEPSLDRELFWLTIDSGGPGGHLEEIAAVVSSYRDWFLELEPTTGPDAQYKTILILFPNLAATKASAVIDTIQTTLKPAFVAEGLMIGQFHANCDEPALWNHDFRPLHSPVPLLAIRYMVRTDAAFLTKDADSLAAYLQRFGGSVPGRLQPVVGEAAHSLGLEYAQVGPPSRRRTRPWQPGLRATDR